MDLIGFLLKTDQGDRHHLGDGGEQEFGQILEVISYGAGDFWLNRLDRSFAKTERCEDEQRHPQGWPSLEEAQRSLTAGSPFLCSRIESPFSPLQLTCHIFVSQGPKGPACGLGLSEDLPTQASVSFP